MFKRLIIFCFLVFAPTVAYSYEDNFCMQQNQKIGDKVESILTTLAHKLRNNVIDIMFYEKWFRVMNDFYDFNVKVQIRKAAYYNPEHCVEIANMAIAFYDKTIDDIVEDFNGNNWRR